MSSTGYNPYDPLVQEHPYPHFADLRKLCPVQHFVIPGADGEQENANPWVARTTTEFYTLSRYSDVERTLHEHGRFRSSQGPGPDRATWPDGVGMLQFADEPEHRFQRRIVMQAIHPRIIRLFEPKIEQIADELIADLAGRESRSADIVADYCWPLPIAVFCEIFGLGAEARSSLRGWIETIIAGFGGDSEALQGSFVCFQEAYAFFLQRISEYRELIAEGSGSPDDLLTALIKAEVDGRSFDDLQIVAALLTMMLGGNDTVSGGLGNCIDLLLDRPDHRAQLVDNPKLWPHAIEEMLRFESPIQALYRTTEGEIQVDDVTLPHDSKVRVMYASANRDEEVFQNADTLDFERDPKELRRHLAFGTGVHACVGILLGRADLNIGLSRLFDQLPGLRRDPDKQPVRAYETAFLMRGWAEIPVIW